MPEQLVEFDSGELVLASAAKRTVTGLLLPFGTPGYTNIGAFTVEAGAITLPADPNVITLNVEHDREQPVGRATSIEERADGVYATFELARTVDGDAALDDIAAGTRKSLSMEAKGVIVRAGKAIAGAIFGAGLVERPAFAGATVIASYNDEAASVDAALRTVSTSTFTDQSESSRSEVIGDQTYVTNTKTESTTTTETAIDTPDDADASESESTMPGATVPETVAASAAPVKSDNTKRIEAIEAQLSAFKKKPAVDPCEGFRVLASYLQGEIDHTKAAPFLRSSGTVFAAQVNIDSPVGDTDPAAEWLGEWWGRVTPKPKVSDLFVPKTLTKRKVTGFTWTTLPTFGDWAGNGADIQSTGVTATKSSDYAAQFGAGGNTVSREEFDFGQGEAFLEEYFTLQANNVQMWIDGKAIRALIEGSYDGATVMAGPNLAAAAAVPANIDAGTSALVDAIVNYFNARQELPDSVFIDATLWAGMLKSTVTNALAQLEINLGLPSGTVSGITLRPLSTASLAQAHQDGWANGSGTNRQIKALAASRQAIQIWTLANSPFRAQAINVANGTISLGTYGYALALPTTPQAGYLNPGVYGVY